MAFNFQRPFRQIEKLFPGGLSSAATPEPTSLSDQVQPMWPVFGVRQIETTLQVDSFGPNAPSAGTNSFNFATARADRVLIPLLIRVLHDNGAARSVECRLQQNALTPTQLAQDPWIRWNSTNGVAPILSLDIQTVQPSFTTTLRTQLPFIPPGNTLIVNFLGMTAAVGTMTADFYYIDCPAAIIDMNVDVRSGSG